LVANLTIRTAFFQAGQLWKEDSVHQLSPSWIVIITLQSLALVASLVVVSRPARAFHAAKQQPKTLSYEPWAVRLGWFLCFVVAVLEPVTSLISPDSYPPPTHLAV
jgi:DMSO reductase anchor subunit